MELFIIPFKDRYIIYRPTLNLAFIGNGAMVSVIRKMDGHPDSLPRREVRNFLDVIGFFRSEPEPPAGWAPDSIFSPCMAVLLMTNACNLRCLYCYADSGEGPIKSVSKEIARKAIDIAFKNALNLGRGEFSLAFHGGGEPTMNWDVFQCAVKYARKKSLPCKISMSSNGVWNERQQGFIIENLSGLSLSFDGIKSVQDSQRPLPNGRGSFNKVMRTINALDRAGVDYGIRMTVTGASMKHLGESVRFICDYTGCQTIQIEPCFTSSRGVYAALTRRYADLFVGAFLDAFDIAAQNGRFVFYSGARPWLIQSSFCRAPLEALVVTPEGDIVTCFEVYGEGHSYKSRFTIGRLDADKMQIDGKKLSNFLKRQSLTRSKCRDCFCYWHCCGDCSIRRLTSQHNDNQTRCHVNREITKELLLRLLEKSGGVWHGNY